MSAIAVTEAVKSIHQAEKIFGLVRSTDPRFFFEWTKDLTALQVGEEAALDRIKTSYLYNNAEGPLTESTVNLLLLSPLLYLTGFCDPPFKIRGEMSVEITAEESGTTFSGRVDALVLQNQLWLILVESKQAKFSFSAAIPQALSYMMASPNLDQPTFGMVTNGDGFLFIKLVQQPRPMYALSDDFSMFTQSRNELYDVARILKRLGEGMLQ
jgi:hypothetical protein